MFDLIALTPRWLVIDKHPDVSFHREQAEHGLLDAIRAQTGLSALYPVHRLDAMTSGLLLFARDPATAAELGRAWQAGEVGKLYLAIAPGKPGKKQGWVKGDMDKSRRGGRKLLHSQHNPAITWFDSCSLAPGLRLYLLRPYTGRTHQLRVALKSLGVPILGDPLYAPAGQAGDRGYLHAALLEFPLEGQRWRYQLLPSRGALFAEPGCQAQMAALLAQAVAQGKTLPWATAARAQP